MESRVMCEFVYYVGEYGAVAGEGRDCTASIQAAIDACAAAGGGMVRIAGGTYETYTLDLKSNVNLHIAAGATLRGGPDPLRYPEVPDNPYWKPGHCSRLNRRTLIYALHCRNVAITGGGTIDGHAQNFTCMDDLPRHLHQVWARKDDRAIPGRSLLLVDCSDVTLSDVLILDSAGWSAWLLICERVRIYRLRIDCDFRLPNVDGIHISSCRDVTISDCDIRSSDDAIVLRAHQEQLFKPRPCEGVVVSNCVVTSGSAAVRIGWSNDYHIRDCVFSNLVVKRSFSGVAILVPPILEEQFDPPRGSWAPAPPPVEPLRIENIRFDNWVMETEAAPFFINVAPGATVAAIRDITFSNVTASAMSFPRILAEEHHGVSTITFRHVRLRIKPVDRPNLVGYQGFAASPEIVNARHVRFDDVEFSTTPALVEYEEGAQS
jgi:hypothetical protein